MRNLLTSVRNIFVHPNRYARIVRVACGTSTITAHNVNPLIISYTYNQANRLTGVSGASRTYVFAYNGLGDRMQSTVDGVTMSYSLDLADGLTQVMADGESTYVYGLGRIGEERAGGWQYHHGDTWGSVRQLTDPGGAVTLAKSYEPYGELIYSAGSVETPYGFTGEWRDSYIKLYWIGAR